MNTLATQRTQHGRLAKDCCGVTLPLRVLSSAAGFYLGTADEQGPCSRESAEYWPTETAAQHALTTGAWNQRTEP